MLTFPVNTFHSLWQFLIYPLHTSPITVIMSSLCLCLFLFNLSFCVSQILQTSDHSSCCFSLDSGLCLKVFKVDTILKRRLYTALREKVLLHIFHWLSSCLDTVVPCVFVSCFSPTYLNCTYLMILSNPLLFYAELLLNQLFPIWLILPKYCALCLSSHLNQIPFL